MKKEEPEKEVIILPIEDKTFSRNDIPDILATWSMNMNMSDIYTTQELKDEFPEVYKNKYHKAKQWFDLNY